jgi:RNA chaperone Hfq
MINRKLVRPNLAELKEKYAANRSGTTTVPAGAGPRELPQQQGVPPGNPAAQGSGAQHQQRRRQVPPEVTSAEAFYYVKQMNNRTPMIVVLDSGERLNGHIEWYDRSCIKVNRDGEPNVLVYKHAIKYMYKEEEEGRTGEEPIAEA